MSDTLLITRWRILYVFLMHDAYRTKAYDDDVNFGHAARISGSSNCIESLMLIISSQIEYLLPYLCVLRLSALLLSINDPKAQVDYPDFYYV